MAGAGKTLKPLVSLVVVAGVSCGYAGDTFFIAAGANGSLFYNRSSKPLLGYSFSFGRDWKVHSLTTCSFEIVWLYRGTREGNRSIYGSTYITWANINWRVGYVALPLLFRFYYPPERRLPFYVVMGVTPCLAVHDGTKSERIRRIDLTGPRPSAPEEADYVASLVDSPLESLLSNSALGCSIGLGVKVGRGSVEFRVLADVLGSLHNLHGYTGARRKFVTSQVLYRFRL